MSKNRPIMSKNRPIFPKFAQNGASVNDYFYTTELLIKIWHFKGKSRKNLKLAYLGTLILGDFYNQHCAQIIWRFFKN
jgi:hypothetical protein